MFRAPRHPYTEALLASIPAIDREDARLRAIRGAVPPIFMLPPGCRFAPRCDHARPVCDTAVPGLIEVGPGHRAACIRNTGYVFPEGAG
jgi:oligopeptide/dipeptide ABC transporter ATP-binding protein